MRRLNIFSTNEKDYSDEFEISYGHYIDNKFDLHASGGANVLGYSNPYIIESINKHINTCTSSFWKLKHSIWTELENKIDIITDYRYESFIPSLNGGSGVDTALKLIWSYWKKENTNKNIILVRKKSFHSGSISGWQMVYNQPFSKHWPQMKIVEFFDDLESKILELGIENIAGVLVDTIPWNGGLQNNSIDWWKEFQSIVIKYNLLLCVDEVLTGIGRLGCWLHSHQIGLKPNIIILGKALSAGHENLSLTIIDNRVTENVKSEWLAIGNTRSNNTMGAVVTCSVIDYMITNKSLDYINSTIIPYINDLKEIFKIYGIEVYTEGTMIQAYTKDFEKFEKIINSNHLYHNWSGFWHLPFYDITKEEMAFVKDNIEKSLTEFTR